MHLLPKAIFRSTQRGLIRVLQLGLNPYIWSFVVVSLGIFLLSRAGFPDGHDISAHLTRSKALSQAIAHGQFPVRWIGTAFNGAGTPLFNYYQSGFYYLIVGLNQLVHPFSWAFKIAGLLVWLGSGLAMYLLARIYVSSISALASAVIFVLTPYMVADVFVRNAFPEIMAISVGLGILWDIKKVLQSSQSGYMIALSLLIGLQLISHLPTVVIFMPVFVGFVAIHLSSSPRPKFGLMKLLIAGILGIGLGSFYVLPAIGEMSLIKSEGLTSNDYSYQRHFISLAYIQELSQSDVPNISTDLRFVQIGLIYGLLLVMIATVITLTHFSSSSSSFTQLPTQVVFWILVLVCSTMLTTNMSRSLWEVLKPMHFIQYPWRFLMLGSVSMAMLVGWFIQALPVYRRHAITGLLLVVSLVIYLPHLSKLNYLPENSFRVNEAWPVTYHPDFEVGVELSYLPLGASIPPPETPDWVASNTTSMVKLITHKPDYLAFKITTSQDTQLQILRFYFPGWSATLNGTSWPVYATEPNGLIATNLPPGHHDLVFAFQNTPIRQLANFISLVSLIALGSYPLWRYLIPRQ